MLWGREVVMWMAVIQAAIALGTSFGLGWTAEQVGAATAFSAALLGILARQQVTPTATLKQNGIDPKSLITGLLLVMTLASGACASRYVPNTTPPQALAYEMREAMKPIRRAQQDLIHAVDEQRTTVAIADRFLAPAAHLFRFTQSEVTPRLRAFDEAYRLGQTTRAAALKTELAPLLQEWNALVGKLFRVRLPDGLLGSVVALADSVRAALQQTRTEFALTF